MPVDIHGKHYLTVAERINLLHEATGGQYSLTTEILPGRSDDQWIVKATVQCGENTYTGHAIETQSSSGVNKTSPAENAETSAVGRALAFAGFGGEEIASANEVEIAKQREARMDYDDAIDQLRRRISDGESYLMSKGGWDEQMIVDFRRDNEGATDTEDRKTLLKELERYLQQLGQMAKAVNVAPAVNGTHN